MARRKSEERRLIDEAVESWNEAYRTNLELWEDLCWYLSRDCYHHCQDVYRMPKRFAILLAPRGPASKLRAGWVKDYISPVYFQYAVHLGRSVHYKVWMAHKDWERRLWLIDHPQDTARLQHHWRETIKGWQKHRLKPNPMYRQVMKCEFCEMEYYFPVHKSDLLQQYAILPTFWHTDKCRIRLLDQRINEESSDSLLSSSGWWHDFDWWQWSVASDPATPPQVLWDLNDYTKNVTVRRAIARNPNTDPALLGRLSSWYPKDVVQNPVLPLLLITNPTWPGFDGMVKLALTKGCPQIIRDRYTREVGRTPEEDAGSVWGGNAIF